MQIVSWALLYHVSFTHVSSLRLTDSTFRENYEKYVTPMAAKRCLWESSPHPIHRGQEQSLGSGALRPHIRLQLSRSCREVVVR